VTACETLDFIDFALYRITSSFPEFLDFCAAQSDVTSEYQQRLLKKVTTLEQLAYFLENDSGDFFELSSDQIVKRRTLLIVCEKLDQFILERKENSNNNNDNNSEEEFQKTISRICQTLSSPTNRLWSEILNHQFLDSVVFSLLQNATGTTCLEVALVILWRIQSSNPPPMSSSIIKVILEKIDEEVKETCFETNGYGERLFSLGIEFLRQATSTDSTDLSKSFFVHNANLVKRVFEKGRFFGDETLEKEIDRVVAEIEKFSAQAKGMFRLSMYSIVIRFIAKNEQLIFCVLFFSVLVHFHSEILEFLGEGF
jgi:hypothetical protein